MKFDVSWHRRNACGLFILGLLIMPYPSWAKRDIAITWDYGASLSSKSVGVNGISRTEARDTKSCELNAAVGMLERVETRSSGKGHLVTLVLAVHGVGHRFYMESPSSLGTNYLERRLLRQFLDAGRKYFFTFSRCGATGSDDTLYDIYDFYHVFNSEAYPVHEHDEFE